MKIVIDINDSIYKEILSGNDGWSNYVHSLIRSGTSQGETGYCKDCKYFEYDSVAKVDGISLIAAHEICSRWGNGCKTKEYGYCFMFEPQESED